MTQLNESQNTVPETKSIAKSCTNRILYIVLYRQQIFTYNLYYDNLECEKTMSLFYCATNRIAIRSSIIFLSAPFHAFDALKSTIRHFLRGNTVIM